jgi:hypothetical protein
MPKANRSFKNPNISDDVRELLVESLMLALKLPRAEIDPRDYVQTQSALLCRLAEQLGNADQHEILAAVFAREAEQANRALIDPMQITSARDALFGNDEE